MAIPKRQLGGCQDVGVGGKPKLQEPLKDPARFPWHEVSKVQHYWIDFATLRREAHP